MKLRRLRPVEGFGICRLKGLFQSEFEQRPLGLRLAFGFVGSTTAILLWGGVLIILMA